MQRALVWILFLGLAACEASPATRRPPAQPQAQTQATAPQVPTRTKVVRLFVVPETTATNTTKLKELVERERAAKNDIFIVGTRAMSYDGVQLVDHQKAIEQDCHDCERTAA